MAIIDITPDLLETVHQSGARIDYIYLKIAGL